MTHHTIIIGAGAAGAILAARLTEDADRSVLLLDAGPDFATLEALPEEIRYAYGRPRNLWSRAFGIDTKYGWDYHATRTPLVDASVAEPMFVPRGRITGGSTAVNAMIFLRGVPEDYDDWAARGNDRWRFQELLPFFRKNERDLNFQNEYHGNDGPILAHRFPREEWAPEHAAFYAACRAAGYADCADHNAPDATGVGPLAHNNVDGIRWSTNLGYLNPARGRPNLTIQADSLVHRILFEGQRAVGVLVEHRGELHEIYADEIIVSAGAIASPQLLLRSGIGPADELRKLDIALVQHLPGVGQNLRDHPQVMVTVRTKPEQPRDWRIPRLNTALTYTASGSHLRNDMILIPCSNAMTNGVNDDSPPIGFWIVPSIYLAAGAGSLHLTSTDPHVQPALNYNYLVEPFDLVRLREGVRITIDLLKHSAFEEIIEARVAPTDADLATDAALDRWMLRTVTTSHHSSGTCKMGPASDDMAVVDQFGKVHGIANLRVADASIMPDCIRANTNVTSMVIGERVADFIQQGL
ncbi:MAG: GMC family oxidoreductase N-terminal domain-containing protein [Caldilineaceae bacterium]